MSKPAKFNREEVIDKATNLYWEKGFHGTSMRNLQDVINMRPGSIYSTFGSKDNLFKEALLHYAKDSESILNECIEKSASPLAALKLFIHTIIITNKASSPSGMCMLVKTVAELTEEHNDLLIKAKRYLEEAEKQFTQIIKQAMEQGEVAEDKDPLELARYLQVQIIGLRTYSRALDNDELISKFIDQIFTSEPFGG